MRLPETPRLVVTLTIAGLLSGLVIVGAYEATLPLIKANQARFLRQAVFEVLPGAAGMSRVEWDGESLGVAVEEDEDAEAVYAAYDADGEFVGWAIPWQGPGFQDTIGLIFGFEPSRSRIVGMRVLESRETPGLGDRIIKDQTFLADFLDLAIEPEVAAVKDGADTPNEIDAITGATISSKAVASIINDANDHWLDRLPEPGQEPAWAPPPESEIEGEPPAAPGEAS